MLSTAVGTRRTYSGMFHPALNPGFTTVRLVGTSVTVCALLDLPVVDEPQTRQIVVWCSPGQPGERL